MTINTSYFDGFFYHKFILDYKNLQEQVILAKTVDKRAATNVPKPSAKRVDLNTMKCSNTSFTVQQDLSSERFKFSKTTGKAKNCKPVIPSRPININSQEDFPTLGGEVYATKNFHEAPLKTKKGTFSKRKARKVLETYSPNQNLARPFLNNNSTDGTSFKNQFALEKRLGTVPSRSKEITTTASSITLGKSSMIDLKAFHDDTISIPISSCCSKTDFEEINSSQKWKKVSSFFLSLLHSFQFPSVVKEICSLIDLLVVLCGDNANLSSLEFKDFKVIGSYFETPDDVLHCVLAIFSSVLDSDLHMVLSQKKLKEVLQSLSIRKHCVLTDIVLRKVVGKIDVVAESQLNKSSRASLVLDNFDPSRSTVGFEIETDSRDTFCTDRAFDAFIKTRDSFYNLCDNWKGKDTFNSVALLIAQVKASGTFKSFSRLFLKQLLLKGQTKPPALSSNEVLHQRLNNVHAKTDARASRDVPQSITTTWGDHPFPALQFFTEFVSKADSYSLNVHLCDTIRKMLKNISSDMAVHGGPTEEQPSFIYLHDYNRSLLQLRLLGYFYGFLVFGPHTQLAHKNGAAEMAEEKLPHCVATLADFALESLNSSMGDGSLLPTVTWVVQALSHLPVDVSWLQAGSLGVCLSLIVKIHRETGEANTTTASLYLLSTIGYLFEDEHLGHDLFYRCATSNKLNESCFNNKLKEQLRYSFANCFDPPCDLLVTCHWRLSTPSRLLHPSSSSSSSGRDSSGASRPTPSKNQQKIKKIQPWCVEETEEEIMRRKFEQCFLQQQPSSLKDTIKLVAGRCFSNYVKEIAKFIRDSELDEKQEIQGLRSANTSSEIFKLANEVVNSIFPMIEEKMKILNEQMITSYVETNMKNLVGNTLDEQVVETAIDLTFDKVVKQVEEWKRNNLKAELMDRQQRVLRFKQKKLEFKADQEEIKTRGKLLQVDENFSSHLLRLINQMKEMSHPDYELSKRDNGEVVEVLEELCEHYISDFYDPEVVKMKCSALVKNRFTSLAFLLRQILASIDPRGPHQRFNNERFAEIITHQLKISSHNTDQLMWLLNVCDQF